MYLSTAITGQSFVDALWTSGKRGSDGLFRWPNGVLVLNDNIDSASAMVYLELALADDPVILRGSDGTGAGDPIGAFCEASYSSTACTKNV